MDPRIRKRIWREINEVNADFFNLRTVISPAPDDDTFSQFYFAMCPNDGALAHVAVVGCLHIPLPGSGTQAHAYPDSPPVVHVYTRTGRFNVDVYSRYASSGRNEDRSRSSMCFDILRSQREGGTWRRGYSLSLLFASLMSALVSFYVAQEGENSREIPEYVSMKKLTSVKKAAMETYEKYRHLLPALPGIPLVEAKAVPAEELKFRETIISTSEVGETIVTAGSTPIYLQETATRDVGRYYTFAIDLSELHADIVFSVILSNSRSGDDLFGKKEETVLVRNGVTATAARKRANGPMEWFYHGKPMNDSDMRLHVTIGDDQMTMAYYGGDGSISSGSKRYVHGDCPVSRLGPEQIGDVRGMPFWVRIYLQKKSGNHVKVRLIDTGGSGYIHDATGTGYGYYGNCRGGEEGHEDDEAWSEVIGSSSDSGFEIVDADEVAEAVEKDREQRESGVIREGESPEWSEVDDILTGALSTITLGIDDDQ